MKFAVVDIETTGATNKITEVAVVLVDDGEITGSWSTLVNPREFLPNNIIWLTGITQDMVDDAPLFEDIAEQLNDITQDRIFIAHSVAFDYGIIKNHYKKLNISFNRNRLCTVRLSRQILPGYASYSLGKICPALGIPNQARHRALGDAKATAELLKILLQRDEQDHFSKALKKQSREAMLPAHLPKIIFDNLPNAVGVYRFLDQNKKVIYVGKALHIKNRIIGHFSEHSSAKSVLKDQISSIEYTLTGNEFLAYLIEANDIKQYFPVFNKAAKFATNAFGLVVYATQTGVKHVHIAKKTNKINVQGSFSSAMQAREFLKQIVVEHDLCPALCGLQKDRTCDNCVSEDNCHGHANAQQYNLRLEKALAKYWMVSERILCFLTGRNANEKAFIVIENGIYKGYGFVAIETEHNAVQELRKAFIPQKNYSEITRILMNQIGSNDVLSMHVIDFELKLDQNLVLFV